MMQRHKNPVKVETEARLLFVPLMFVFLRIWDLMNSIMYVYHPSPAYNNNHHWLQPLTVRKLCMHKIYL